MGKKKLIEGEDIPFGSPLELFTIVFNLAFIGKNFFEGVVRNKKIGVGKDAVYDFLNSSRYNWRRFTLLLCSRIYVLIKNLLDDSSEDVLIIDDSTYDRSRSKKVELLSKVYDHCTGKQLFFILNPAVPIIVDQRSISP